MELAPRLAALEVAGTLALPAVAAAGRVAIVTAERELLLPRNMQGTPLPSQRGTQATQVLKCFTLLTARYNLMDKTTKGRRLSGVRRARDSLSLSLSVEEKKIGDMDNMKIVDIR